MMSYRRACVAAAAAGVLVWTGCKPEPTVGSVDVGGDSITVQAILGGGLGLADEPEGVMFGADLGARAVEVLPWVQDQVADGRPETLVVALGTNEANRGWTWADIAAWVDLLNAPHPDACVAIVLPAVGESADPGVKERIEDSRAVIPDLAEDREGDGGVVITDWRDVITEDPTILDPDGIHLAWEEDGVVSEPAAQARMSIYWESARQCQELLDAADPES